MLSETTTTLTMTIPSANYVFSHWQEPHFRPVNQFYRRQKHKGSASGDELVFVVKNQNEIVAAVRLVPNTGFYWLRSLYVDKTLQGQGLGTQLLTFVHQHIEPSIYCFPYSHLEHFYTHAGYTLIAPQELPNDLQQLFTRYKGKGENILAMARQ